MGCFDGYLFCTDIDGTLTVHGELSQENADAIRYFQSEGGLFTVSTGREPGYIRKYKELFVPNTYMIAVNGTLIYDPVTHEIPYQDCLGRDALEVVRYAVEMYPYLEEVHTTYSLTEDSNRYVPGETIDEHFRQVPEPWYKMIFCIPAEPSDATIADLLAHFGDHFHFDRSWPNGIEMHSGTSGKGECIERLRELLGDRASVVVAAGDYENDITMLQHADIGYAVGNAIDALKVVADRVTVTNEEHAISAIIEELRKEQQ